VPQHLSNLFHISDRKDIAEFVPRAFWHVNYVRSGSVRPCRKLPDGADIINVVWAEGKDKLPFYFLPRSTPRLWFTTEISGSNISFLEQFCDTSDEYKLLIVPTDCTASIERFSFYKYTFSDILFNQLPNSEWASFETVQPVDIAGPFSALKSLANEGVALRYVKDIHEVKKKINALKIKHHSEKI